MKTDQTRSDQLGSMLQFPQILGVFDLNGNLLIGLIQGNPKPGRGCQWSHRLAIWQHVGME